MNIIPNKVKKFLKTLGPGFISGSADDDPTAIAAYTQAGAQFGYHQLWTTLFTLPFMIVIQEMCGRIGMVTGKGLSGVIRKHYPRSILYFAVFLLLIANTINIGANLGVMASSAQLLIPLPFAAWLILITVCILLMEIFISYQVYAKILKYLALTLVSYVVVALLVKHDWQQVFFSTVIPYLSLDKFYILNIMAILGTNISPFIFFWQADEEVEEDVAHHRILAMGRGVPKIRSKDLRELRLDTIVGMVFSNIITFFICLTAASTLFKNGFSSIDTAAQAAQALRPLAGDFSFLLFAIGIIGSGLLAVPILAGSASYAIAETFGWKEGLSKKFKQAHGFYGVIILATIIGLLVNFTPIKTFDMLYYAAAINALLAPPLLIIIMMIANNKKIMGEHVNSVKSNIFGSIIITLMTLTSIALLYTFQK